MKQVILALLVLAGGVWAEAPNTISLNIIQGSSGAMIGWPDSLVDRGSPRGNFQPLRGLTGVHYVERGRSIYFREGGLAIQDGDRADSLVFLYHRKGTPQDQLTRLPLARSQIVHLTYPGYAVAWVEGQPESRVALWETKTPRQPAWGLLGALGIGLGVHELLEWRRLNPARLREVPPNVVLRPDYYNYDRNRWQEKDLARQQRTLKRKQVSAALSILAGLWSIHHGLDQNLQVNLGNGTTLTYSF